MDLLIRLTLNDAPIIGLPNLEAVVSSVTSNGLTLQPITNKTKTDSLQSAPDLADQSNGLVKILFSRRTPVGGEHENLHDWLHARTGLGGEDGSANALDWRRGGRAR